MRFELAFVLQWSLQSRMQFSPAVKILLNAWSVGRHQRVQRHSVRIDHSVRIVVTAESDAPMRANRGCRHIRLEAEIGNMLRYMDLGLDSADRTLPHL